MARRMSINDQEAAKLVNALKTTEDWDKAKRALPDVDPGMLNKGWKAWAFKKAGMKLPAEEQVAADKAETERAAREKAAEAEREAEKKKQAEKPTPYGNTKKPDPLK